MTTRPLLAALSFVALVGLLVGAWRFAPRDSGPPDLAPRPAKATAGRFAVQDGGKTVLDRISGRRWQQGSSGSKMDWAAAKIWCSANTPTLPGNDWRLPSLGELVTLVDVTTASPTIDPVFGGQPATSFWSSTPKAFGDSVFWLVYDGNVSNAHATFTYWVRCVR